MTIARLAGGLLSVLLVLDGCRLSPDERLVLQTWLLCDDCSGGERQRVAAIGGKAVPALASALIDGPPPDRRSNMARQLRDLYSRLASVGVTEVEFVTGYLDNYVTTYRVRAAMSLGDIQTPKALQVLQQAIAADSSTAAPLPPAVRLAVHTAAATAAYPPFTGSLNDSSVAAFDTVTVRRGAPAWDGDESVTLRGGPFPAEVFVMRASDSMRFLALGAPGSYQVTIENEGTGPVRAPLRISSLRYEAHPPAFAPDFATRTFPLRLFFALGNPPATDTVEYFMFRIGLAPDLPLTAVADWRGPGNVDLTWRACTPDVPVGNLDGATNSRPERTKVIVPSGECWLLIATVRGSPAAPQLVKLDLSSP